MRIRPTILALAAAALLCAMPAAAQAPVVAEGDLVVVTFPREMKDLATSQTATWFDKRRFVDGKADDHRDGATK